MATIQQPRGRLIVHLGFFCRPRFPQWFVSDLLSNGNTPPEAALLGSASSASRFLISLGEAMSISMLRASCAPVLNQRPEIAAILQVFLRSSHLNLRRVTCELQDGWLVLHGVVPTFHLKQLAQEAAWKAVGRGPLRNEIQVRD